MIGTAANTAGRISTVSSCVAVLLAIETLAYYFSFVGFFDFDFRVQQGGKFEDIIRVVGWFEVNKE